MLDLTVGSHQWSTRQKIVNRLAMDINELTQCRDLLLGIESDRLGYYEQKKQKMGVPTISIDLKMITTINQTTLHINAS
jgi:hypothetical protein